MSFALYFHQEEALKKMKNGCILCGEVGSGKSRTGLAYYFIKECGGFIDEDRYIPMRRPKDLYIITTARKRDTLEWVDEMLPFKISIYPEDCDYDISVVVDSWNNVTKYKEVKGAFFIFDEQRVVGNGTWVKSFLAIAKANHWILLSATPGDTWSDYIPVFIANGFYKNRTEFLCRHAVYKYGTKYHQIDHYVDQGRLMRFKKDILVTMSFNRQAKRHHIDILVDYDRELYRRILKDRWDPFEDVPIENVSKLCYLLRKVSNSHSDRQEAVLKLTSTHPRSIIFYNHNYELEILKNLDYGEGFKVAEWNGNAHEPIPSGEKWVYLVQYSAGAEGWNCIQTNAIIFYSQSYSYKMTVQAAGRIDRLNTPYEDLYFYHLKSSSAIDVGISRALKKKKNFQENSFIC